MAAKRLSCWLGGGHALVSVSHSDRERQRFVWPANEKLVCLLLLIFSGLRPSREQKEPLHSGRALCQWGAERPCRAITWKTAGELNLSSLMPRAGRRGLLSKHVGRRLNAVTGEVGKIFIWNKKTLWVCFNQRKLLITKHIKAEITKVAIGCYIFIFLCVTAVKIFEITYM